MSSGHTLSVDHWSLGILIFELLMGYNPFDHDDTNDMVKIFQRIPYRAHDRPSGNVSAPVVQLIDGLLEKDPEKRLGSLHRGELEILQHPWFDEMELTEMRRRKLTAPWIPTIKDPLDASCFDDWSQLDDKTKLKFPQLTDKEQALFVEY